jgi:hypothetical protein
MADLIDSTLGPTIAVRLDVAPDLPRRRRTPTSSKWRCSTSR